MVTKKTLKRCLLYVVGLTLLGLCVTLMQKTHLGMSSWDALNRNFYEGIPLDYKYLTPMFALVMISLAYVIERRRPDRYMLVPLVISFYIGVVIDTLLLLIPSMVERSIYGNLVYLLLAIVVCAIGLNLIILSTYPLPALDAFCNALSHRLNLSFGKGKLIGEIIALCMTVGVGLMFHHQEHWFYIGPTTVIFAGLIGFFVDGFKKPLTYVFGARNDH